MKNIIEKKIQLNERITDEEARYLYEKASLEHLQRWATQVKTRFHDPQKATYNIMRIINYTNVCVALCDYCAFYELPHSTKGYVITWDEIGKKIDEILKLGGDVVGFNGGFNPNLKIDWYLDIFQRIREKYGDRIEFHAVTVAELMYIAKRNQLSYFDVAKKLKESGVRWITGGGAEILTNSFRERHSPHKYSADEFFVAQEEIVRAGVNTTGTMVIGFDETIAERVEHLRHTREFQDKTNGLFSFLSWTYKPDNTKLGGTEISNQDYLRHLAVARIYLDHVKHIRTSVLTQNENALKGLHYGADDFDIPLEDEVTQKAGATINQDIQLVLARARSEGFETVYRHMALRV